MTEERAAVRRPTSVARRLAVTVRPTPVAAPAHPTSAARTLQQRLGNRGTQAFAANVVARTGGPGAESTGGAATGKFSLSQPGDASEREADRVADAVMRMPDSARDANTAPVSATAPSRSVQRLCAECDDKRAKEVPAAISTRTTGAEPLQRKENGAEKTGVSPSVAADIRAMRGSGSPLPAATRAFFEPRFGADFGKVRIHTGARAGETAKSISAKAFTVGSDIAFAGGHYAPESREGQKLLAHELTHVVQQGATPPAPAAPTIAKALDAPKIQRAWYNVNIPFTDYQFDPSIEGIKTAAGIIKDTAEAGLEWIVDEVKSLVSSGIQWLSEQWNSIQEFASSAFEAIKSSFLDIVSFFRNPLGFLANAIMSLDAQALAKGWAAFSGLLSTVANGFKAQVDNLLLSVNKVWGGINNFATSLLNRITNLTSNFLFKKLPDAIQGIAFAVIDQLKGLWKSINDGWTKLFNKIKAWIDSALDVVFSFVRRVLSFGINVVIAGIIEFGQIVLFLKDLFADPQKYVELLAKMSVQAFKGVEGRFAGVVAQHFGGAKTAAAPAHGPASKIDHAPAPASSEAKNSATWSEIGSGIATVMHDKWEAFKANPMTVVKGLLIDLIFPILGNVKDIIQLFVDIKNIVTGPLSAGSLEELWTSLLQILDIPILIYRTVISILMRTLMIPLVVATFIPHPLVKAIAAAVGEALLAAFVEAEGLNLAQKLLLLKTGVTTKAQKEEAYNRIGDSLIALAMTAAIIIIMLILHFIANLMKGVYNFIKGKIIRVEPTPVEAKGTAPGEGKGTGSGEGKGTGENKAAEAKSAKEGLPSEDGQRKIKIDEDGKCEVCASPCEEIRKKYASVMTPEAEAKIKAIEDDVSLSDLQKEEKLKPIEQELAEKSLKAKAGKLIGDISDLSADEVKFVQEQVAQGRTVEIVPRGAGRTPDFKIDGKLCELKTISGVADPSADNISKAIANRVMNGRGQATDIIVDARGQPGITEEIAQRGVRRAYGADNATGGKITSIRVIGPGFDITVPRK